MSLATLFSKNTLWVLLSAGIGLSAWHILSGKPDEHLWLIANSFASVGATLFGFLLAALSIIGALMHKTLLENMRRTGHLRVLLREMAWATLSYMAVAIASLSALFLQGEILLAWIGIVSGLFSLATLLLLSAGQKFWLVVEYA